MFKIQRSEFPVVNNNFCADAARQCANFMSPYIPGSPFLLIHLIEH
jgi:hypothetical protein